MILILTADSNTGKIYHYDKKASQLTLLKEITHPENKLKTSEIASDKNGHYQYGSSGHGAFSPRMTPKEVEIENFSRELAKELNQGRVNNEYKELILITSSHMCGLLSQHLNKHVKNLIVNTIQKDILHLSESELLKFVKKNTRYPSKHNLKK